MLLLGPGGGSIPNCSRGHKPRIQKRLLVERTCRSTSHEGCWTQPRIRQPVWIGAKESQTQKVPDFSLSAFRGHVARHPHHRSTEEKPLASLTNKLWAEEAYPLVKRGYSCQLGKSPDHAASEYGVRQSMLVLSHEQCMIHYLMERSATCPDVTSLDIQLDLGTGGESQKPLWRIIFATRGTASAYPTAGPAPPAKMAS